MTQSATRATWFRLLAGEDCLELHAPYQRGSVWTVQQRQLLIKSFLLGVPVPTVIVNDRYSAGFVGEDGVADVRYAVVDGKQRVETILAWFADELAVPASWFPRDHLEGVVETDGVRLRTGALVPASRSGACDVGDAVHLSVRPEKIHINDLADGMVAIDGELRDIIYLGTTTQYVVEVGQGAVLIALEQNVHRAGAHARPAKGSRMRLGWHPENSLVLRASA